MAEKYYIITLSFSLFNGSPEWIALHVQIGIILGFISGGFGGLRAKIIYLYTLVMYFLISATLDSFGLVAQVNTLGNTDSRGSFTFGADFAILAWALATFLEVSS